MSNMSQLFDASRFPDDVKVRANGKATVMTLYGSENGSLPPTPRRKDKI